MDWRRQLYEANRYADCYNAAMMAREQEWIDDLLARAVRDGAEVSSLAQFQERLRGALDADARPTDESDFVARLATREQFAALVGQYAVDGLTEAQAMLYAVPRLPPEAQMPVVRVLIDEFGCGNLRASHSQLFRDLLGELGLPLAVEPYLAGTRPELFDSVNVYHWLTRRAPAPDYYLGALAYAEAVVPLAFRPFQEACERLGVEHKAYFGEHIHIDEYHARDALKALRQLEAASGADFGKAWLGVAMVREAGGWAFRAAVDAARKGDKAWTAK